MDIILPGVPNPLDFRGIPSPPAPAPREFGRLFRSNQTGERGLLGGVDHRCLDNVRPGGLLLQEKNVGSTLLTAVRPGSHGAAHVSLFTVYQSGP